ncbi:MAG: ABC transporter permease [Clostridiales bacterium]|nr:ABC transporter permease [Clostridiales bacterium]
MNNKFKGWRTVFGFTYRQATKGAGYKVVTSLVAILIILVFVLINILVAKPDDDIEPSIIKSVFVLNNSGLEAMNLKELNPQFLEERYKDIEFIYVKDKTREETIYQAAEHSSRSIAVIISARDAGYDIETVVPNNSEISDENASELLPLIQTAFESGKLMQSGLSAEQLSILLKPVVPSYEDIGESTNIVAYVIKMIAPMVFGLIMYMMLMLYGQSISKSISTEKTSKLMETLLISIHPYGLITGKVLAMTSIAVLQFLIWIVAAVIGLYGGNAVASAIYPEYENSVITIINFLKVNIGESAMTLPAVILAIIIFCVGFLFFCVLAGLAGSMVSKPEEAANTQGVFVFPILISWLFCYITPLTGNEGTMRILRLIPLTIPFSVPVDLITGVISIGQGILSLAILLAFSLLVIMLSARLYKGLVLYTGQKLSLRTLGNIIRAKAD